MPLFSVIMPAYNRASYIGESLTSVMIQGFPDWECIVIDDGSRDCTPEIARAFVERDNRFRLIERVNGGPGAARNQGAAAATGRYLAFLDSDDVWMEYALETYRDALEQAGWPEFLAAQIQTFSSYEEPAQWVRQPLQIDLFPDALDGCSRGGVTAGVPMTVVSAEAFRSIGGFLEDCLNSEDHDLTLRLGDCRGFVAVRAPATVAYRQNYGRR